MSINIEQLLDNAELMVATQNYEKAITIYSQIIEVKADCDEAYLFRGELYGKLGNLDKAFEDVFKAIDIDPEYDESHMVLAALYKSQNNLKKAIESYQRVIELNKNSEKANKNIIQLYEQIADKQLATHQVDKAIENFQHAIDYAPDNINLLYKHAFSVSRAGDFNQVFILIDKILKLDHQHVPTRSLLAAVYEKTAQLDKGWEVISSLSRDYPKNPFINITYGKYALRNNQQKKAISKLREILQQTNLKIDDQLSMHMLLGKLYDSISEYQSAYTHFSLANNLKYNDYDIAEFEAQVSSIIDYFSIEKYKKLPSSTNQSSDCIFIIGMPRSGTSLVEQIISSHSTVFGGGELQYVPQLSQSMAQHAQYPQLFDHVCTDELNSYANELIELMKNLLPDSQRITDKLPHNFLFVGLIHKLLPNAKIINCIRNPVDTCLSCYFQHFGGYHPYAYNLSHLGKYYQQYSKLTYHWESKLQIPVYNVYYEKLIQDTKNEVKGMLNYLELDWEDECMEFHKQKRAINTASYTQVNKEIYTGSMNRWLNYESHISELLKSLGESVTNY